MARNWQQASKTYRLRDKTMPVTDKGFTIIEILIVLAVAGLILLLVFEAVPSLERSSRNHQRRQDVQTVLGAVSHWELNHSGNIPAPSDNFLQYSTLTYYDASSGVHINAGTPGNPASVAPTTSLETVDIYDYQKCSTTTQGGSVASGAGYNDIVALYAVEVGSSGTSSQCQQL